MKKNKKEGSLVGRSVSIDRDGSDQRTGLLLADQNDHLVLYDRRDGIVYYPKSRVNGVRLNEEKEARDNSESDGENQDRGEERGDVQYFDARRFASILESLRLTSVRFNRGGQDQVDGVLVEVRGKEAVLVNGNEVIRLPLSDIRDIGDIVNTDQEEEEEEENDAPGNQRGRRGRNRNNRHSRR